MKSFKVHIIDDVAYEADEEFYIEIFSPQASDGKTADLGLKSQMTIVIIDDDDPGVIAFKQRKMVVAQQADASNYEMEIVVQRRKAATGAVSVKYKTEQATAIPGRDYEEKEGTIYFEDKQVEASIFVTIIHQGRYESTDVFRVVLFEPTGGAVMDDNEDGDKTRSF